MRMVPETIYLRHDGGESAGMKRRVTVRFDDAGFAPSSLSVQCDEGPIQAAVVEWEQEKQPPFGVISIEAQVEPDSEVVTGKYEVVIKATNESGESIEETIPVFLRGTP